MNELLCVITLVISFTFVILSYKFLGKTGLFLWIAIATIVSNIQTVKLVNIFGIESSLGTILYGSTFLATDILNLKYAPSSNDFAQQSLITIFTVNIRITIASLIAFAFSQFIDTILFQKLQKKYNKLWLSNNASTMICQIIDTIIFCTITYYGLVDIHVIFQIMISMYAFKFVIALCDTPYIYIASKIKKVNEY